MLPKKSRFNRSGFSVFGTTPGIQTVFNRLGTLKYIPSTTTQYGVVTSSKHEKLAVVRNRLRRRVYTLFGRLPLKLQAVLFASKHAYTMEYAEVETLFNDLLSKIQKNSRI
jgi:ribonuclease P protein component